MAKETAKKYVALGRLNLMMYPEGVIVERGSIFEPSEATVKNLGKDAVREATEEEIAWSQNEKNPFKGYVKPEHLGIKNE